MTAPDARTRNKVALNLQKVRSSSLPVHRLPQIFLSNVLFVLALNAGKEWLLNFDVGIFWVTLRVLACGGLVVLVKEALTGGLAERKSIEVCDGNMITGILPFELNSLDSGLSWECHRCYYLYSS